MTIVIKYSCLKIYYIICLTQFCCCIFIVDNLSQGYKSRLIQSVINLLSYLIESSDGNLEINAVSPWLLIYNLLK